MWVQRMLQIGTHPRAILQDRSVLTYGDSVAQEAIATPAAIVWLCLSAVHGTVSPMTCKDTFKLSQSQGLC